MSRGRKPHSWHVKQDPSMTPQKLWDLYNKNRHIGIRKGLTFRSLDLVREISKNPNIPIHLFLKIANEATFAHKELLDNPAFELFFFESSSTTSGGIFGIEDTDIDEINRYSSNNNKEKSPVELLFDSQDVFNAITKFGNENQVCLFLIQCRKTYLYVGGFISNLNQNKNLGKGDNTLEDSQCYIAEELVKYALRSKTERKDNDVLGDLYNEAIKGTYVRTLKPFYKRLLECLSQVLPTIYEEFDAK